MIKRLTLAFVVLLFSSSAFALTVSWEPPSTRADGTAIGLEELANYTLRCYSADLPKEAIKTVEIPANVTDGRYETTYQELLPARGAYECDMTVTDIDGLTSVPSDRVDMVWEPSPPNAPTITIIIN